MMSQNKSDMTVNVKKQKTIKPRFNRYRPRQMRKTREEYEALQILSIGGQPPENDEKIFNEFIPVVAVALAKDAARELMYWVKKHQYMDKAITMKLFHHTSGVLKVECVEGARYYYSLMIPHNYLQSNFGEALTERFVNAIDTIFATSHYTGNFEDFECIIWNDFVFGSTK